ncbi:MAG: arsenic efflux protein [Candidatus Gastranaerophilales bacterium]|nr:arsenic efflux protein [Candidatus Gastranaerophilales bacterium]MCM1525741.1 arsenic efflux protein [Bacteroides sp.]
MHLALHALEHTIEDSLFVLLALFVTYLVMEYLEHRTESRVRLWVQKAGRMGPAIGALLGVVPQCGFSAAASDLYAGRVITMGTLIAIYLSTSDEMLPVMISSKVSAETILTILGVKILVGMTAGFVIDLFIRRRPTPLADGERKPYGEEHDDCGKGIVRSALKHTVQVGAFLLLVSFGLNLLLELCGEDVLAGLLLNRPVAGPVVAGLVGFIPNCAASVVITELYLEGVISAGSLLSGLLVGAGVGLLVLFRVNRHRAENFKIAGILYTIGVLTGIVAECI